MAGAYLFDGCLGQILHLAGKPAGERWSVVVADIRALERFILDRLSPIPGVEKIRSSFTLKQVRYKTALPLSSAAR